MPDFAQPPPAKAPFAHLSLAIGDADKDGTADVRVAVRIGTLDLPPVIINMDAGKAIGAVLSLLADWRLGFGK